MSDPYAGLFNTDSFVGGQAVVPNDVLDLPTWGRALWIGGAGNLNVTLRNGNVVTLTNVAASTFEPLKVYCRRVWATGTTATGIVALW